METEEEEGKQYGDKSERTQTIHGMTKDRLEMTSNDQKTVLKIK